eukprot:2667973-Prymnesium_polylepis.2
MPGFWGRNGRRVDHSLHYDVEPGADGMWLIMHDGKKSSVDFTTAETKQYAQLIQFSLYTRGLDPKSTPPWIAPYVRGQWHVVASAAPLSQWVLYEVIRGLTFGSFAGAPTLTVFFEPTQAYMRALSNESVIIPITTGAWWRVWRPVSAGEPGVHRALHEAGLSPNTGSASLWATRDPSTPY